jgi:MoaA/NifB/PqqE/SkfB family radical SAM enzyme
MNNYKNYSPGVSKLLHHLDHLKKIAEKIPTAPLHVSVWPTSTCQLNCVYCCGRNIKDKGKELGLKEYTDVIDVLYRYGTKAIELSGTCGEPLLWSNLDEAVKYTYSKGLKLSLITNGLALKNISDETLASFSWIRVSLQSLAHAKSINWKNVPTKISASYMVYDNKSLNGVEKLYLFAKQNDLIIRIAVTRPCSIEWENKVRERVELLGKPLFFAEKERGTPEGCFMPYIRGAIDWNGWFLPCPSIELNIENEGYIPLDFRLCHISELEQWILNNPPHDLGYRCKFCNCGKVENSIIYQMLDNIEDVDFV